MMTKILIVDDSEDFIIFLSYILRKNGFQVETTTSKNELNIKLMSFIPDLILLDVRLKEDDGRDLCKEIKAHPFHKDIPVILLSASPDLLIGYDECGAVDVIPKPFDIPTLISKIQQHLKVKKSNPQLPGDIKAVII